MGLSCQLDSGNNWPVRPLMQLDGTDLKQNRMRSPQHPCFVQHANLKLVISLSESDSMVTQVDVQGVVLDAWPPALAACACTK